MAKTKTKDKETEKAKDKPTVPKARSDAYVMMLFITFVAIVAGTVLMYLDHDEYGGKKPPEAPKITDLVDSKGEPASPPKAPPAP